VKKIKFTLGYKQTTRSLLTCISKYCPRLVHLEYGRCMVDRALHLVLATCREMETLVVSFQVPLSQTIFLTPEPIHRLKQKTWLECSAEACAGWIYRIALTRSWSLRL